MSKILLVTSSPRGSESLSTRFADQLAQRIVREQGGSLIHRDLGASPVAHLDEVTTAAIRKPAEARTAAEAVAADRSDQLVAELLAADTVIISTGMINFGICSTLKSWIDNIARAGMTFRYTETGPIGLVIGKKVYVVISSGGIYSEGPFAAMDHAIPYLKAILGFLGLQNIEVIQIEGLAYGPEAAERAIAATEARIVAIDLAA